MKSIEYLIGLAISGYAMTAAAPIAIFQLEESNYANGIQHSTFGLAQIRYELYLIKPQVTEQIEINKTKN